MKRVIISLVGLALIFGCSSLPDEKMMEKAQQYEMNEEFVRAAETYEKIVKIYPRSPYAPEALYRAGLVYNNGLNESEKAISLLDRMIKEYPESDSTAAQCQFMIGFIYANNVADTANARLAYTTFLERYPGHELVPSVQWELKYLGKDINDIPELMNVEDESQR